MSSKSTEQITEPVVEQPIDVKSLSLSEVIIAFKRIIKNDEPRALRKLLKDREDLDINLHNGWALIYSIENDCFRVFKVLVKHPDIDIDVRCGFPLLTSIENERYECFKYLLKYDAKVNINPQKTRDALKYCCDPRFRASMMRYGYTYLATNIPAYITQY